MPDFADKDDRINVGYQILDEERRGWHGVNGTKMCSAQVSRCWDRGNTYDCDRVRDELWKHSHSLLDRYDSYDRRCRAIIMCFSLAPDEFEESLDRYG